MTNKAQSSNDKSIINSRNQFLGIISKFSVLLCLLFTISYLLSTVCFAEVKTDIKGEFFGRYEWEKRKPDSFKVYGSELGVISRISSEQGDIVTLAFQIYVGGSMRGPYKDMHYGNIYAIFPLRIGLPNIKAGQFVIPFGVLAEFDDHYWIPQTLYPRSLGLRIDTGIALSGILGSYDYWLSATNGNGPNIDDMDFGKVISARVAREWEAESFTLKYGFSALKGYMPLYETGHDPQREMNMAMTMPTVFAHKKRFALDFEYSQGPTIILGELVAGTDGMEKSGGFLAMLRYQINSQIEGVIKYDSWKSGILGDIKPLETSTWKTLRPSKANSSDTFSVGLSYTPFDIRTWNLQVFYELWIDKYPALKRNVQRPRLSAQLGVFF